MPRAPATLAWEPPRGQAPRATRPRSSVPSSPGSNGASSHQAASEEVGALLRGTAQPMVLCQRNQRTCRCSDWEACAAHRASVRMIRRPRQRGKRPISRCAKGWLTIWHYILIIFIILLRHRSCGQQRRACSQYEAQSARMRPCSSVSTPLKAAPKSWSSFSTCWAAFLACLVQQTWAGRCSEKQGGLEACVNAHHQNRDVHAMKRAMVGREVHMPPLGLPLV